MPCSKCILFLPKNLQLISICFSGRLIEWSYDCILSFTATFLSVSAPWIVVTGVNQPPRYVFYEKSLNLPFPCNHNLPHAVHSLSSSPICKLYRYSSPHSTTQGWKRSSKGRVAVFEKTFSDILGTAFRKRSNSNKLDCNRCTSNRPATIYWILDNLFLQKTT